MQQLLCTWLNHTHPCVEDLLLCRDRVVKNGALWLDCLYYHYFPLWVGYVNHDILQNVINQAAACGDVVTSCFSSILSAIIAIVVIMAVAQLAVFIGLGIYCFRERLKRAILTPVPYTSVVTRPSAPDREDMEVYTAGTPKWTLELQFFFSAPSKIRSSTVLFGKQMLFMIDVFVFI